MGLSAIIFGGITSQLQGVGANTGIEPGNRIDGQEGAGRISEQSQLHGEVKKASVGARSFFYHPATITLFTLFTGGLYGIVLLGHYFATKPSAIAKMSADSTETPKIHNTKELKQYLRLRSAPSVSMLTRMSSRLRGFSKEMNDTRNSRNPCSFSFNA